MIKPLPFDCPRGLNRIEAARYIGVSPTTFDKLVIVGAMPQPKRVGGRRIFDRAALDAHFDNLDPTNDDANDWDQ